MTDQDQPTQPMNPTHLAFPAGLAGNTWQAGTPFGQQQWWKVPQQFWHGSGLGIRLTLLAAALLLIMGCGIASIATIAVFQHILAKPDGYLWSDATDVVFVEFTEDSTNHINGTMHSVSETSEQTISAEDIGFTGVANGSRVNVTFSAPGYSSTFAGTLNGDTFTLQVPDQNGYIVTDVFHAASVQDYNNAAANLRELVMKHIAATQSAQATVTAQYALDQAVTNANNQLGSDLASLTNDDNTLKSNSDFSGALNVYGKDWTQMQTDYQKEQSDYQQGCGSNGYNASVVSYDASTVSYDLSSIQYDDGSLSYDQNTMNGTFNRVQTDIQVAQTDWQNLQAAVAADTTGTESAQFAASDVNTAVTDGQNQMNASNKALTDAQGKASTYDKEAAQMNTDAQNLANGMHC